ncbi:hypothetical protein RAM80_22060 [Pseudomonas sp. App30]|uniref:hypothetical protein n=1 Tax=Pseudomonas sp. App30 TaxID=3068990 RepID=UPI003A80CC81
MTDNLYAPPQADLRMPAVREPAFYTVSDGKFFTLFFASLGLYLVYWSWKNWRRYQRATGAKVSPLARGLLPLFFTHALLFRAEDLLQARGMHAIEPPEVWANRFVVATVLGLLFNGMARAGIGYPLTDLGCLAALVVQGLAVCKGQQLLNFAADDPLGEANSRLHWVDYVCMVPGILLWVFILLAYWADTP